MPDVFEVSGRMDKVKRTRIEIERMVAEAVSNGDGDDDDGDDGDDGGE